ncbi:hypothetical protein KDN24_04735 [Bacillus sp. Bva_UNVM-123]|uniref:hypothetical protein n=1 Tax=Bacillus sp. Bva_UNVM-123 TaxID=2829798 RepID=UPI00391F6034
MEVNVGDMIFQLVSLFMVLIPIVVTIIVIIFILRIVRRMERRADERLQLDKENVSFQQQQMLAIKELNNRLTNIENMLKEVE